MSDTRHNLVSTTSTPPTQECQPHLNRQRFELECTRRRLMTDTQRAAALGVSNAQLSKILACQSHPGARFIHATMTLFDDCDYDDLFIGACDHHPGGHR